MKAAVLREVGKPLQIEDVKIGKPGPHEVLIRTAAAGVCHSDLHFMEGKYPYPLPAVLGHESAGVVEAVGSEVRRIKPGVGAPAKVALNRPPRRGWAPHEPFETLLAFRQLTEHGRLSVALRAQSGVG